MGSENDALRSVLSALMVAYDGIGLSARLRESRRSSRLRPARSPAAPIRKLQQLERAALSVPELVPALLATLGEAVASDIADDQRAFARPADAQMGAARSLIRYVIGIVRSEVARSARHEEAPLPWEDRPAIENRMLHEELGVSGIVLARLATPANSRGEQGPGRVKARKEKAARDLLRDRAITKDLFYAFLAGLRETGVELHSIGQKEARKIVRRAVVAASVHPDRERAVHALHPKRRSKPSR